MIQASTVRATPDVFEYLNYREFLRETYLQLKGSERGFSFREFSRISGFTSPNFLKLVMDGDRNLSAESAEKIAAALELEQQEGVFFKNLVLLNQSETAEQRLYYAEQISGIQEVRRRFPLREAALDYYRNWYYVAVRELVSVRDFQEDPDWIARQFVPAIAAEEAREALQQLFRLNLIGRDANGRIHPASPAATPEDEVESALLAGFHRQMLQRAGDSIDLFPRDERELSAATIGLSEAGLEKLKGMLRSFRDQVLALAAADPSPERVFHVGLQVFPLSQARDPLKPTRDRH